jgi:hypothetical protein
MLLRSRLDRLDDWLGIDDTPRRVVIWFGPGFEENWIERRECEDMEVIEMCVKTFDHDADPLNHLTPEQAALIRPGDWVVVAESGSNERDEHLEMNRPPWMRRR